MLLINPLWKIQRINQMVIFVSIVNCLILIYTAWIKYNGTCPSCNQLVPIPVNSVFIALAGIVACIVQAVLTYLHGKGILCLFWALLIAGISSSVASYLQVIQFLWAKNLCYPCLTAASLFYLMFCLLMYQFIKLRLFNLRLSAFPELSKERSESVNYRD